MVGGGGGGGLPPCSGRNLQFVEKEEVLKVINNYNYIATKCNQLSGYHGVINIIV